MTEKREGDDADKARRAAFLAAVQKKALSGIWSKGVRLRENGAVTLDEATDDEETYHVRAPGKLVAPLVVLYLDGLEWSCDCDAEFDPCEHVVAAAIAAHEAAKTGRAVEVRSTLQAELGYALRRDGPMTVAIDRIIVHPDGRREPLTEPLERLVALRRCPVEPSHGDLLIDRLLVRAGQGKTRAGTARSLAPESMAEVLEVLSKARHLTLDGEKIAVDTEPLLPEATVTDQGDGVVLTIAASPRLGEVLDRGLALAAGKLRPLGGVVLTGPRLEKLPLTVVAARHDIGTFATKTLPEVERIVPVEVLTKRLPGIRRGDRPRLHFEIVPEGARLSVLPTLVYGDPPMARIDGSRLIHLGGEIPQRNEKAEQVLVQRLREELDLVVGRGVTFDGADAARFVTRLERFRGSSGALSAPKLLTDRTLVARIAFGSGAFTVHFEAEPGGPEAATDAVLWSFRQGLDVVPLSDGTFAKLPSDWLSQYGSILEDLLAARRADGTMPKHAGHLTVALAEAMGVPVDAGLERVRPLFEGFERLPEAPLPTALTAELRPYQKAGVDWLSFLRDAGLGGVLADDMGLGKTLMTLAALPERGQGRTLVVCPRSLIFNWSLEVARFRPDLRVGVYHGSSRRLDREADVTLTTYSVLRLDQAQLSAQDFRVIVLDEAQAIKNPDSQAARAAVALSDAAPDTTFRLALSGTPIENRLDELWSIYRFTSPGLLGGQKSFKERYVEPLARGDADATLRLKRLFKPFLLRRLKRDVLGDLPPRTNVTLTVELDEEERRVYDALFAAKRKEVVEALDGGGGVMAALEALLRLRQAACHTGLVPGQTRVGSSKVEALVEAVDQAAAEGHKSIVFSQWTSLLDLVEPELERRGIAWVRLDGKTKDRGQVVAEFQAEGGPPVFLSSLKAGGTGVNLTAADHVFLLDPWWNPAVEDQASDRAHRIGQVRPVTVYRMITKDTVEEGVVRLQEKKREVAEALLDEGGAVAGITREDLLELLGG